MIYFSCKEIGSEKVSKQKYWTQSHGKENQISRVAEIRWSKKQRGSFLIGAQIQQQYKSQI